MPFDLRNCSRLLVLLSTVRMKFKKTQIFTNFLAGFPWASLPEEAMIVDVGGGSGRAMTILSERFASLKYVVQDLPRVCARAREVSAISWRLLRIEDVLSHLRQNLIPRIH